MGGVFEVLALERNEPLIPAHVGTLVDGHGEMAAAEQLARVSGVGGDGGGNPFGVKARAGAHLAGRCEIDDEHAHRSVALRLQDETALELERGTQHDGEHDGLAQELGHRERIVVAAQDGIDRRPQPHNAAAQVECAHFKRQDGVIGTGSRRLPNRDVHSGIVH